MTTYRLHKEPKKKLCPGCGNGFKPSRNLQKFCSPSCELKSKSGRVDQDSDFMAKDLPTIKAMAKGVFDLWIRNRDKDKGCITGNHPYTKSNPMQAGHVFKCETNPHLMFDERNCFGQCQLHNNNMDDPKVEAETRKGAELRLGNVEYERLCLESQSRSLFKMDRGYYIDVIKKYEAGKLPNTVTP